MQLSGEGGRKSDHSNTFQAFRNILSNEGPKGLYQGLSANICRQATYTTVRVGMYQSGVELLTGAGFGTFTSQILSGLTSGVTAAMVGAPSDVALVRMMSDGRLPEDQRRNYRHVGNAITRIVREEGFFTLWRGLLPATVRAILSSITQLVTYSRTKHYLISNGIMNDGPLCHFGCSLVAGLTYTICSNPVDVAKTRIQTMFSVDGKPQYSGIFDVWTKTVRTEGVKGLWKGFLPYYLRMGPQTTLLLVFTEQITYIYSVYILKNKESYGL
ncbi:mitochondrial 2-oxoglutarate/malate carrier protein-like isoform X2 [Macrosteles quadrilineatus]|nr:mitochondrial 2-oxoglutarate/malate carrier protein-like isoform X2 [Macrosteles quadrilineatus]